MLFESQLAHLALRLDPLDQEALAQFQWQADYLTVHLDEDLQMQLKDRLSSSIQMLALASISEEALLSYRAEIVAAARAIEQAAGELR